MRGIFCKWRTIRRVVNLPSGGQPTKQILQECIDDRNPDKHRRNCRPCSSPSMSAYIIPPSEKDLAENTVMNLQAFWDDVLLTDESKEKLLAHNKNVLLKVKHGAGGVML